MSTDATAVNVTDAKEKKHRRMSIAFSAVIENTATDSEAVARTALALERVVFLTDLRHLSISVQGAFSDPGRIQASADRQEAAAGEAERSASA